MSSPSPSDPPTATLAARDGTPVAVVLAVGLVGIHLMTGWWAWDAGEADAWHAWIGERSPRVRILVGGRYLPMVAAEPWRLASSVLLHVDALHCAVNAAAVVVVGRWIGPLAGPARLLGWFALGGLAGGVAGHLVGIPQSDGASAGLSAWIGAGWWWASRRNLPDPEEAQVWVKVLGPAAALNILIAIVIPGIDAMAHTAGTLAGVAAAAADRRRGPGWGWAWGFAVFAVLAGVGLTGVAAVQYSPPSG